MSEMKITFYEAVCKQEITIPSHGRCERGQTYKLNQWDARYWGAAFDMKNAKVTVEKVKMDSQEQSSVTDAINLKTLNAQDAHELIVKPPKGKPQDNPKRDTKKRAPKLDGHSKLKDQGAPAEDVVEDTEEVAEKDLEESEDLVAADVAEEVAEAKEEAPETVPVVPAKKAPPTKKK